MKVKIFEFEGYRGAQQKINDFLEDKEVHHVLQDISCQGLVVYTIFYTFHTNGSTGGR